LSPPPPHEETLCMYTAEASLRLRVTIDATRIGT
jgi:hypothetical protein